MFNIFNWKINMITIEKNIPAPLGYKLIRKTLDSMEIGDSFLVGVNIIGDRGLVHREMKNHKNTFSSRSEKGGMCVWRFV